MECLKYMEVTEKYINICPPLSFFDLFRLPSLRICTILKQQDVKMYIQKFKDIYWYIGGEEINVNKCFVSISCI